MKKIFMISIFLLTCTGAYAQGSSVSLTTYYPSPFGAYDRLQLVPRADSLAEPCNVGTIFVRNTDNTVRYCKGDQTWGAFAGGPWVESGGDVYLADTNNLVGIGTISPTAALTVNGSVAVGQGTSAGGDYSFAAGFGTSASGDHSVALGQGSQALGSNSFTAGFGSQASGDNSVAIGQGAQSVGPDSLAVGFGAQADGDHAVAFGHGAQAGGDNSLAVGFGSQANGNNAAAFGQGAIADNDNSIAVGFGARADGVESAAVGFAVQANADNSFAFGKNVQNDVSDSMMIGFAADPTLYIDAASVGIGTTDPTSLLEVLSANDEPLITVTSFAGSNPGIIGKASRGAVGSPTAVQSDDTLMFFGGRGYGQSAYSGSSRAAVVMNASEGWTNAAQGAHIRLETTANGTTVRREVMRIDEDGNVGIGTQSPSQSHLEIEGNGHQGIVVTSLSAVNRTSIGAGNTNPYIEFNNSNAFQFLSDDYADVGFGNGAILMVIEGGGDVGVGVQNPSAKLHVAGNIKASLNNISGVAPVNMRYNSGTNEIGYDLAELFATSERVEAGDLLVVNEGEPLALRKSRAPYEKGVVGIVSNAPAVLFEGSELQIAPVPGEGIKEDKVPVALSGRILCKVTNENGPIERGDLLTSSSTPGHAMKATDRDKAFGTVVGKALEPFSGADGSSTGMILILATLQ